LGSRASNWFDNIVRDFGRIPTADELDKQIVKHTEEFKTLSDSDAGELRRFVGLLEDAKNGIKKIEDFIKPKKAKETKEEGGGFLGKEGIFGVKNIPII